MSLYLFNLHNSNICRLFKVIEPLLAGKITINKDRSLTSEKLLPINSIKYADLGYQGLQSNVVILFKRLKKISLTKDMKTFNRNLASFRMKVEHKIREIKIFKIMSYVYRNFQKKYNIRFNIIADIVNLKHGF